MKSNAIFNFWIGYYGIIFFVVILYRTGQTLFPQSANNSPESKTSTYHNICKVNQLSNQTVKDFASFSLDKSDVLFVHFHGNNLSNLEPSEDTEILDPTNLVWVDSITAPFLSLDLGFNVYSLTTLWRKVHNMSVVVDFESPKCLQNTSYSCVTASLATAFLTTVSQDKGALCYVIKANGTKYKCCQRDSYTDEIKCGFPASISHHMSGVFYVVTIVGTILFVCFPAIFAIFPDEIDSSQTISGNTQVRNPLYRIGNFVVQKIQLYSAKHYLANVIKKLLIGFSLPVLFYVDWGLVAYTVRYDIPKMFNNAVRKNWQESKLIFRMSVYGFKLEPTFVISCYGVAVLISSLFPRTEKLNLSHLPDDIKERIQEYYTLLCETIDYEMDWVAPCVLTKKCFMEFCFGFKESVLNGHISPFWRIINFLFSCIILSILPFISILIFICYGWHVSPLGRQISIFRCNTYIYIDWLEWQLIRFNKELPTVCQKIFRFIIGCVHIVILFFFYPYVMLLVQNILSCSLLLITRFITYLFMGIVASKDDFLSIIALVSLFVFYIWNCVSSVENEYKDLLDQTFDKCKEYEEETKTQVIKIDNKGVPRIKRLSDLFQNVVNEIQPFSKEYTKMCLKIVIIGCFLFLTYYSILVFGNTSLNDLTKTLAVSLAGLIPKLIEIFRCGMSKELIAKENSYRIKKIVYKFFDNKNADDEPSGSSDEEAEDSDGNISDENSLRSLSGLQRQHQIVYADMNPRSASINSDQNTETTPLLQSRQNSYRDQLDVV